MGSGGSGDGIEDILALGGGGKCKKTGDDEDEDDGSGDDDGSGSGSGDFELSGADALAAALGSQTCDLNGMDDALAQCLSGLDERVKTLEQAVLSGEGGGLEDQITLVLVKKGVIDCENDTQCADDMACLDSVVERGRKLCESPCDESRMVCRVPHSECVVTDHVGSCQCKEGFHGNATDNCIPDGFEEESNGKHYKMFDDKYVEFDEAVSQCEELGARLPVLDSAETIKIVKKYLEVHNFSVFEQWDRSSRRVWLGLMYDRSTGLLWADGKRVMNYRESALLFVWEARRLLSQEASRADATRHYGFYIDGDIAKLPGGGRKGAAVLCELLPPDSSQPNERRNNRFPGSDGGYPNFYRRRN